ncbi:acetyl-CoA carboxylase biotin carboxyl carrier protein subunit [Bacteroidota bacterium]
MVKKKVESGEVEYSKFVIHTAVYKTLLTEKFLNREKWEPQNDLMVKALIPGNINKVHVKIGDNVKVGDRLLVLEAMKMYNQILAPVPGKVKHINVKEGQIVPKGTLLLELE